MKRKRKNIKTSIQEIIDYWIKFEDECYLNFDWSEADSVCWRCGYTRKLQRCHIIPDSLGGMDEPSNLVLLCSECHQEAPNVESTSFMWDWIKSYHAPFYNTFWSKRAMDEYERIYHKSFTEELMKRNIVTNHALNKFWNLKTGRTSFHFGHPYGNVSTIAGNYRLHIEAFDKKYPTGKYLNDEKVKIEKHFENLTNDICSLAKKYNFSVWEGGTKNPYSLCISAYYPIPKNIFCISIRMNKNSEYFMFLGNEYNPNHIPIKSYTIKLENNPETILNRIEKEIQNLNLQYGDIKNENPYFLVPDPYWKSKSK